MEPWAGIARPTSWPRRFARSRERPRRTARPRGPTPGRTPTRRTGAGPGLTATPKSSEAVPCKGLSAVAARVAASHRNSDSTALLDPGGRTTGSRVGCHSRGRSAQLAHSGAACGGASRRSISRPLRGPKLVGIGGEWTVEDARDHERDESADGRAGHIDPHVNERARDNRRTEGSSRIHGCTREWTRPEATQRDRRTDRQRGICPDHPVSVGRPEDHGKQEEGGQTLDRDGRRGPPRDGQNGDLRTACHSHTRWNRPRKDHRGVRARRELEARFARRPSREPPSQITPEGIRTLARSPVGDCYQIDRGAVRLADSSQRSHAGVPRRHEPSGPLSHDRDVPRASSSSREREICNEIEDPQSAPAIRSMERWPRPGGRAELGLSRSPTWTRD